MRLGTALNVSFLPVHERPSLQGLACESSCGKFSLSASQYGRWPVDCRKGRIMARPRFIGPLTAFVINVSLTCNFNLTVSGLIDYAVRRRNHGCDCIDQC